MAIKLVSTRDAAVIQGVKMLVSGPPGAGKTRLCATLPNPIILSAESGLLSLAEYDLPAIEIKHIDDMAEVYEWLTHSDEAKQFESVALDSISEIAEVCLSNELSQTKDPRKAYGALSDHMTKLVRTFRDMPGKHIYMAAKQNRIQDELSNALLYGLSTPGKKLANDLPYLFDECFALRAEKDAEGNIQRWLQTQRDAQYDAKDRSGKLDMFEPADLGAIIKKIVGE